MILGKQDSHNLMCKAQLFLCVEVRDLLAVIALGKEETYDVAIALAQMVVQALEDSMAKDPAHRLIISRDI